MRNVIYKVVKDELNWKEKIIVKLFNKTFLKIYNISRIKSINSIIN